jgi:peptidoglycan/LPS O-acetylase OafA/YrhL
MNRLRELDFLRGLAIILVLLRHISLFDFTTNIGWIGVDLFFVLSGFLVSQLLFKEYIKFGNIKPQLFLIRRGFKIYPVYYIFYLPYLFIKLRSSSINLYGILSDFLFIQNYMFGWGYAYVASWSLAVEEHFYFGFAILLWWGLKTKKIVLFKTNDKINSVFSFGKILVIILIFIFLIRILFNSSIFGNYSFVKLYTMTHLRVDSLVMGVLISYLFTFYFNFINNLFLKNKYSLLFFALLGLVWTPFLDPGFSYFVKTIGFTFLYISFGIILLYILLTKNINELLNKYLSKIVVDCISKIGFCSYSIYIIHGLVIAIIPILIKSTLEITILNNKYLIFLIKFISSVLIGVFITYRIEKYFLLARDKYFPSRAEVS